MVALPNSGGIQLENAANNLIGGTDLGARNVISGSRNTDNELANGIYLILGGTTGNVIQGNYFYCNRCLLGRGAPRFGGKVPVAALQ
jgi:hypothetical protein